MNTKRVFSTIAVVLAAGVALIAVPGSATSKSGDGLRSFHGKVRNVAAAKDAFSITNSNGTKVRFRVNSNTVFRHVSGLSGLSKGMPVEVKVKRGSDSRLARKVEAEDTDDDSGDDNGGQNGGSDDPPGDDHGSGGHGSDDPPGDDHGSGAHGSDDPPGDDHGSGGHGSDD